jgi:hypothetical protein
LENNIVFKSVSTSFLTGSNHHTSFELLHTTPAIKDLAFYSTISSIPSGKK